MAKRRRRFALLEDLPLRPTVAAVLMIGLLLPVSLAVWRDLTNRRTLLFENLQQDHARLTQVMAIAMATPIWDVRPDTGQPLVDAVMRDARVTGIVVNAPTLPEFLTAAAPERGSGRILQREEPIVRNGEVIGSVRIDFSTGPLEAEIAKQWRQVLLTGFLQLLGGLVLLFPVLRLKVLNPIDRLVDQSRALAAGELSEPIRWQRGDEMGTLGRSMDDMRCSLSNLVADLKRSNADLQAREADLQEQAGRMRVIFDHMTDGISLVDADLRLRAWNDRFTQLLAIPAAAISVGVPLTDLHRFERERGTEGGASGPFPEAATTEGFLPGQLSDSWLRTANGRVIAVRRQLLPNGGFVTTYTDFTAQVEARRKVEETLSLLEAVLDAVPVGVHLKDRDLVYRIVNRSFLDMWGLQREDIVGRTLTQVFGADVVSLFEHLDRRVLADGNPVPFFECPLHITPTTVIDTLTTKIPLRAGGDEISHIVTVHLDISARKAVERALRESEERNRLLVDLSPFAIMLHDTSGIRFLNPAGCKILDIDHPELVIGRHYMDFVAPCEREVARKRVDLVLEGNAPNEPAERRLVTGNGRDIDVLICAVPFDQGGSRFALVMFEDISARKTAERERQRWLQLFHDALESIPDGFGVYDAEQRLVLCNSAFAALYDETPEQLVGSTAHQLAARFIPMARAVDGVPAAPLIADLDAAIGLYWSNDDQPLEVEFNDGRWLQLHPHQTQEGGLVVLRLDVTNVKQMQRALSESEELYRTLVSQSPYGIMLHDAEAITFCNPAGARVLGADDPETLVGRSYLDFVAADEREEAAARIALSLEEGTSTDSVERRLRSLDGRDLIVATSAVPIHGAAGRFALIIFLDITERKRLDAQMARQRDALHQAEKMSALGSLLAGVAHELNNPLSVVVGRAIMLEEATVDPQIVLHVTKIRAAAERCARIVKTFLAMARKEAPVRTPVQIPRLLDASIELLGYSLRSNGITVHTNFAADLPQTQADADQLTQVFNNLILNAMQAMADWRGDRRLDIAARWDRRAETIVVTIADSGPGIPPAIRPRIFDPFFTTKPAGVGTGIGLAVCRGIIDAHAGSISVESSPSSGAIFTLVLPVVSGQVGSALPSVPPPVPGAGRSILVVDDEPEIAQMLADIVAADGHRVTVAGDGRAALHHILEQSFDLILTDLVMPELDGPGLYRLIRTKRPRLAKRVIFVTGDTLSPVMERFLSRIRRPVLEKPFTPDEVRRVIHAELTTQPR